MEIEHRRAALAPVHLADRPARERIGQHAEEPAAAGREPLAGEFGGGHRDFEQLGPRQRLEREARRVGPAVMVVRNRRDARRIGIALLGELEIGPRGAVIDREARRAVAGDREARRILDHFARAADVGGELFAAQRIDPRMVPAVTG